jgi:hypothetical protein
MLPKHATNKCLSLLPTVGVLLTTPYYNTVCRCTITALLLVLLAVLLNSSSSSSINFVSKANNAAEPAPIYPKPIVVLSIAVIIINLPSIYLI